MATKRINRLSREAKLLTDKDKARFLECLADTGNISGSAAEIGFSRMQIYTHRKNDAAFAEAWDSAMDEAVDGLRREARRRGKDGFPEPVFYQGRRTDTVTRYSNSLLALLLKAHAPEFKETGQLNVQGGGVIRIITGLEDSAQGGDEDTPEASISAEDGDDAA